MKEKDSVCCPCCGWRGKPENCIKDTKQTALCPLCFEKITFEEETKN